MNRQFSSIYLALLCLGFFLPNSLSAQLSWQKTSSIDDIPTFKFISLEEELYACMYGGGIFKTDDEGENWMACHDGLPTYFTTDIASDGNNLFVATRGSGVLKSSDKGVSWQSAYDNVLNPFVRSLMTTGGRLFAGTVSGLYFSDDEGNNWQKAALPTTSGHHKIILSLATDGRLLMAGSNSSVFISKDFGETWQVIALPTLFDIKNILHQNGLWLISTSGDGIFSSADGVNWNSWNKEAANTRALILAEEALVLGLSDKVIRAGENLDAGLGISSPAIRSLGYHKGKLYAGTYRQGIWRYDIPKTEYLPPLTTNRSFDVRLFPNPTGDGQIAIEYQLEENETVRIQLLDSFGKKIAEIVPSVNQVKGVYTLKHQLDDLVGGTYYVHLQIGDQMLTKPFVLIK